MLVLLSKSVRGFFASPLCPDTVNLSVTTHHEHTMELILTQSHSHTILLLHILNRDQMSIHPLLKIVPRAFTVYPYLLIHSTVSSCLRKMIESL